MNQLAKQGIPKDRIKLSSIQYGDNAGEVKTKLSAKKGQMVALVDFARLPAKGERKPDFWSDHHVQESASDERTYAPGLEGFLERWRTGGGEKNKQIANLMKSLGVKDDTPEERKRVKEALKGTGFDEFISLKKPSSEGYASRDLFTKIKKEQVATKKQKKPISDQTGAGRIGKTEFPSETEHLATVHAQGLMTSKDIQSISNIDAARYKNLSDVIDLPKEFKAKGRMDRLANLTNALVSELIKSNPTAINQLIKNSSPTVVSVYNNVLKMIKLNNEQAIAIKELSKETPDWKKIDALRNKLPKEMAKEVIKEGIKEIKGLEQKIKKGKEDIVKQTGSATTKYRKGSDVVIIQQSAGRGQPSRFLGSLLTKPDGTRYPAHMREWATFIQISLNPSLDVSDKEKIDLTKVVREALSEVHSEIRGGKIKVGDKGLSNWAFNKVIFPESGGHAGIANISGLGTLGLAPKATRERFKELEKLEKRVKKIGKEFKKVMPKKAEELARVKEIKDEWKKERKMIINEIKKRVINKVTNKLKSAKPIVGEERFKGRKTVKEEILNLS
tara:strand:- start:1052 stop:2728 length:1677 start_codon:yes stop_codon:yes gene_type:complete